MEASRLGMGHLVCRDRFLDLDRGAEVRRVLERWHGEGRSSPAGIGREGTSSAVRGDSTMWIEPVHPAPISEVFDLFEALMHELAEELRLGLQRFSVQAARYGAGAGYERHLDAFRGDPSRIVTAIVYLNPDWEPQDGGQLRAWTPDGEVEVAPHMGRLVLFRSDEVPHEVMPTRVPRWAVTAWYRGGEPIPLLPDPP